MLTHLRANLWLLLFTLVLCSVLYPLVLWGIGQTAFHDQAQGSLVKDEDGNPVGSRLIAQAFNGKEYFQPRPSAASYNAAASGASNYGASNYLLRDRVARQLGPIVEYDGSSPSGKTVQEDVEDWFQKKHKELRRAKQPGMVALWATTYPSAAKTWVTANDNNKAYVTDWMKQHPDEVRKWKDSPGNQGEPKPEDLAAAFWESYAAGEKDDRATFPSKDQAEGETKKTMKRLSKGEDIQAYFFDLWLQANPRVKLKKVPADMVMASGSGLDPHITLKNAQYQLDRVAGAWAEKTGKDKATIKEKIETLLEEKQEKPLGGLVGVPLINVLEVNLVLRDTYGPLVKKSK